LKLFGRLNGRSFWQAMSARAGLSEVKSTPRSIRIRHLRWESSRQAWGSSFSQTARGGSLVSSIRRECSSRLCRRTWR